LKYLCTVIVDEKKLQAMSAVDSQVLNEESLAYNDILRKSGHFVEAQALESVNAAKTVRLQNGKPRITDVLSRRRRNRLGASS
jgi:hypothetical protein